MGRPNTMRSVNSNTVQAFWFGSGKVASLLFTVVVAAVLARYLEMREYGTYRQILYIYGSLQVVFTVGLPRAYGYFLATLGETEGRAVVSRLTLPLLGMGALFGLVLYLGAPVFASVLNNPELARGLKVFAPIPLFLLPTLGIEGVYSAVRRSHVVAVYQLLTSSCMAVALVLPVVLFRHDYIVALYGWNAASFIAFVVALRLKYRPFPRTSDPVSSLGYRTIFAYTVPLMTASLYGIAFLSAGKFFISRYFGEVAFAEFANGFQSLPFVGMVAGSTAAVLLPVFTRQAKQTGSRDTILATWKSAWKKSATVVYPLLIFALVYAESAMVLLYGVRYAGSAVFFRIALLENFFAIITYVPLILAMGESRFYAQVHLVVAAGVWIGGFATIWVGGSPAAIASLVVLLSVVKSLWFIRFIAQKLSCSVLELVPVRHLAKLLGHSAVVVAATRMLVTPGVGGSLVVVLVGFAVYGAVLASTSRLFRLDYLSVLAPLLGRRLAVAR